MEKEITTTEKLFNKYSYLAKVYANKVFDIHKIALEKQDVEQELSIKIFTSIEAYGRRYSEFLETGKNKPVPLKYYIKLSLINKVRDYIKVINYEVNKGSVSLDEMEFDYGVESNTIIDPSSNKFIINDIDLLVGLNKKQSQIFTLFLKGFSPNKITKITKKENLVKETIDAQLQKLRGFEAELTQKHSKFHTFSLED